MIEMLGDGELSKVSCCVSVCVTFSPSLGQKVWGAEDRSYKKEN